MKLILLTLLNICLFTSTSIAQQMTNRQLLHLTPNDFFKTDYANLPISLHSPNQHLLSVSIFQATNLLRQKHNLPILTPDFILHNAGLHHAKAMKTLHFFDHNNPYDSKNKTMVSRVKNQGGQFMRLAENIALVDIYKTKSSHYIIRMNGQNIQLINEDGSPLEVMTYGELGKSLLKQWFNSKGHRKNLLNPKLTRLGTATVFKKENNKTKLTKVYAVQNFGSL